MRHSEGPEVGAMESSLFPPRLLPSTENTSHQDMRSREGNKPDQVHSQRSGSDADDPEVQQG